MDHGTGMDETVRHGATSASAGAQVLQVALSLLAILLCASALGAVLGLVALSSGVPPCWPMLVGAPVLIWILRSSGSLRLPAAPLFAVIAVLLAGAYAECLDAVARVSAVTGASFAEAWHLGGAALTLQVAQMGLSPLSVIAYGFAAIMAAWLANRGNRKIPGAPK
ncbi:MAG: hypothetical protein JSS21_09730 [Proteobacteria bacterium]|nr:hypothetical protein [Pseudomonadota bacterium]